MRNDILSGNFILPTINKVEDSLGKEVANFTSSMISALWHNFLVNKSPISSAYWCDKLGNPNTFNVIVSSLSKAGYINSRAITERNWLEIELNEDFLLQHVTPQELEDVRKQFKFAKYRMRNTSATSSDLVRKNGKVQKTGLDRSGFLAAANTQFSFDLVSMKENEDAIAKNLTKSMTKIREKYPEMGSSPADYDEISLDMLKWLQENPQTFTRGTTFLDSRGRAISSSLGKIANPIGNKDFRSLLVIPEAQRVQATDEGADTIYLFIAELNGYKSSEGCEGDAIEHKRNYGLECYLSSTFHTLDLEEEDDRSDLHENIWLQRLYNELDAYYGIDQMTKELALVTGEFNPDTHEHYWSTPVELDAGASMLQYAAMLLNSKALAEMTNMYGEELSDPWNIEGLPRNMVKKAATPMLNIAYEYKHNLSNCWEVLLGNYTTTFRKLGCEGLKSS